MLRIYGIFNENVHHGFIFLDGETRDFVFDAVFASNLDARCFSSDISAENLNPEMCRGAIDIMLPNLEWVAAPIQDEENSPDYYTSTAIVSPWYYKNLATKYNLASPDYEFVRYFTNRTSYGKEFIKKFNTNIGISASYLMALILTIDTFSELREEYGIRKMANLHTFLA